MKRPGFESLAWLSLAVGLLTSPLLSTVVVPAGDPLAHPHPADEKDEKEGGIPAQPTPIVRGEVAWHAVEIGLGKARESYFPLIVVYPGPEGTTFWEGIEQPLIESSKKQLEKFVAIEVAPPLSERAMEIFGGLSEPMIALCDFRGVVLKRWNGDPPSRGGFRKYIRKTRAANAELANLHHRALTLIRKARYALKTENTKECVKHYLDADKLGLPAKSEPGVELGSLRKEIDEVVAKRKKEAEELEEKKKYVEAIAIYERLMSDFPLPDLRQEIRKKISKLWGKLRGYGG